MRMLPLMRPAKEYLPESMLDNDNKRKQTECMLTGQLRKHPFWSCGCFRHASKTVWKQWPDGDIHNPSRKEKVGHELP